MSRYVDIEPYEKDGWELVRVYSKRGECLCSKCMNLSEVPAADVQEVRHGHWEDINPENYLDPRMKCSVCGEEEVPYAKWKFCPNCGASMNEATEE